MISLIWSEDDDLSVVLTLDDILLLFDSDVIREIDFSCIAGVLIRYEDNGRIADKGLTLVLGLLPLLDDVPGFNDSLLRDYIIFCRKTVYKKIKKPLIASFSSEGPMPSSIN